MVRRRLREAYSPDDLQLVYPHTYNHTIWEDHRARITETVAFANDTFGDPTSIADLSCGDAAIPNGYAAAAKHTPEAVILGDFVAGHQYHGMIEDTIGQIPPVDVFILSETLEHVDDPDALLTKIRAKAQRLILSTPLDETLPNAEHYWSWAGDDLYQMLVNAGWTPRAYRRLDYPQVDVRYQLWAAQ